MCGLLLGKNNSTKVRCSVYFIQNSLWWWHVQWRVTNGRVSVPPSGGISTVHVHNELVEFFCGRCSRGASGLWWMWIRLEGALFLSTTVEELSRADIKHLWVVLLFWYFKSFSFNPSRWQVQLICMMRMIEMSSRIFTSTKEERKCNCLINYSTNCRIFSIFWQIEVEKGLIAFKVN